MESILNCINTIEKWPITYNLQELYILPNSGGRAFSILDNPAGNPLINTAKTSKKVEWGAIASTGASSVLALFPLNVTHWHPKKKKYILPITWKGPFSALKK